MHHRFWGLFRGFHRGFRRLLHGGFGRQHHPQFFGVALGQLGDFLRPLGIVVVAVQARQASRHFDYAAVVAVAQIEVEQLFVGDGVAGSASYNLLGQFDGLVGHPVAGEKIDVGQRSIDKGLGLLIEFSCGRGGTGGGGCSDAQFFRHGCFDCGRFAQLFAQLGELLRELQVVRLQTHEFVVEVFGAGEVFRPQGGLRHTVERFHAGALVAALASGFEQQLVGFGRVGPGRNHRPHRRQERDGVALQGRLRHPLQNLQCLLGLVLLDSVLGELQQAPVLGGAGGKELFR